jgi:hypothetical protein
MTEIFVKEMHTLHNILRIILQAACVNEKCGNIFGNKLINI